MATAIVGPADGRGGGPNTSPLSYLFSEPILVGAGRDGFLYVRRIERELRLDDEPVQCVRLAAHGWIHPGWAGCGGATHGRIPTANPELFHPGPCSRNSRSSYPPSLSSRSTCWAVKW
jgi:hypothetical protein